MTEIRDILEEGPLIAAVKDLKNIDTALKSSASVIFMLCGSILNMKDVIKKIKSCGKYAFIHMDLVEGLGKDSTGVEFLKRSGADGIITTRPSLVKDARNSGIYAIQRLFMLDSRSLESGIKTIIEDKPHAVEIMPAIAAKVIGRIHQRVDIPVIAGGLILDKGDIIDALSKGAIAVSTTDMSLWEI